VKGGEIVVPGARPSVAVFRDFENEHATVYDVLHGDGAYRRSRGTNERLVPLGPITRAIGRQVGAIKVHRAYANWGRFRAYYEDLVGNGIDMVFVPCAGWAKNGADIRLACEAMRLAYTDPGITHYVIVSCDADFSGLAQELRRLGKVVVGLGIRGAPVASLWRHSCDQFFLVPCAPPCRKASSLPGSYRAGGGAEQAAGSGGRCGRGPQSAAPAHSVTAEYRRILEGAQLWLDEPAWRARALAAAADLLHGPEKKTLTDHDVRCFDGALAEWLEARGLGATKSRVTHFRCLLRQSRLLAYDGGRWLLRGEANAPALERAIAQAVLEKLAAKTAAINLPAVSALLRGQEVAPDDALRELAAKVTESATSRETGPAPLGNTSRPGGNWREGRAVTMNGDGRLL
jgi:hypothetical protein